MKGTMVRRLTVPLACMMSLLAMRPALADTECVFGGPTPGAQVMRLDLPSGSSFLTLELSTTRTTRPVAGEEDWHLAVGLVVINADSLEAAAPVIEAYRVTSIGMWPRRVVVQADGMPGIDSPAPVPEIPYAHERSRLRDGLPAGSYLVVGFGTDGGGAGPNEYWMAGIQVSGTHACVPIGNGESFDYDHTEFSGGTQAYAPGLGYGEGIRLAFDSPGDFSVGLMDAQTQAKSASSVRLKYSMPSGVGESSQELQPFVSVGGRFEFEARYVGWSPLVLIAGAGVDLGEAPKTSANQAAA